LIPTVFNDFYIPLNAGDMKNYQSPAKVAKKHNYTLLLTAAGSAAGVIYPVLKTNKHVNMEYAIFVKEKLKPLMTAEFDKTHRQRCVPRFSKNPVTHIKGLKDSLKYCEEDIQELLKQKASSKWSLQKEKFLIDFQTERVKLMEMLNEYKILFININNEFKIYHSKKLTKRVLSAVFVLSTIGTTVGMVLDKIIKKRDKIGNNFNTKLHKI